MPVSSRRTLAGACTGASIDVPFTALELVLEEIHSRRRASLRDWQESGTKRNWRENGLSNGIFSDDIGKDMERLSLVHPSWTSISRNVLGRIAILSNLSTRSARAAASSPTLGTWTREVYLTFSRYYDEGEEIWEAIESVLARTPSISTFCLQTASNGQYRIHLCVKRLTGALSQFAQLRTLRLYCDIGHGNGTLNEFLQITEHPTLFHALEKSPDFECLMLRNFLPCYKLDHCFMGEQGEELFPSCFPGSPDPYAMCKKVESSSPLAGRAYSLAELIRSICNTPTAMTSDYIWSAGNSMPFATFMFNLASQQFVNSSARILESCDVAVDDIRPPSFQSEKWCHEMEFLDISCEYGVFKSLCPFPSLKFLYASLSASHKASPYRMKEELHGFLVSLPPTLEFLKVIIYWEDRGYPSLLPPNMHDELDEMLATIPSNRCPNLKVLAVDIDNVTKPSDGQLPLTRLIDSCEKHEVPLLLHGWEAVEECHGVHDQQEAHYLLEFENHIC